MWLVKSYDVIIETRVPETQETWETQKTQETPETHTHSKS